MDEEENLLLAAILLLREEDKEKKRQEKKRQKQKEKEDKEKERKRKKKSVWTRQWLLHRPDYGWCDKLLVELAREDLPAYRNFLRVSPDLFQELLNKVGPIIERKDTFMRKALTPTERLAITLRYLATGDSYKSMRFGFRVAHNTISVLIPETCEAIIQAFGEDHIPSPKTPAEWKAVAKTFSTRWNFEHTLGAIDGKHIAIRRPPNSGSLYYNYKGFYSIVLLGVVDGDYKFIYVDVGANGSCSDASLFIDTSLRQSIEAGTAGIPAAEPLPGQEEDMPYFLVGDDAFPLRRWLMKPYPHRGMSKEERIFNYRLSRARRIVENAFGILANR